MSLYDRDYARNGEFEGARSSSALSIFIKQTYQLFAASLLAGAAGAYVGTTTLIPLFARGGVVTSLVFFGVAILLLFALQACKRKAPLNLVLLFAFTFIMGASLAPLLYSTLALANGGVIVAQAFGMTAVAFGALSLFAMNTKRDFTMMGKLLFVALIVLVVASLIGLFFQSAIYTLVISSVAAILFSLFILYDTQNIIRGNYETPVEGAVSLYLDFLNLFSSLLSILNITNRE